MLLLSKRSVFGSDKAVKNPKAMVSVNNFYCYTCDNLLLVLLYINIIIICSNAETFMHIIAFDKGERFLIWRVSC